MDIPSAWRICTSSKAAEGLICMALGLGAHETVCSIAVAAAVSGWWHENIVPRQCLRRNTLTGSVISTVIWQISQTFCSSRCINYCRDTFCCQSVFLTQQPLFLCLPDSVALLCAVGIICQPNRVSCKSFVVFISSLSERAYWVLTRAPRQCDC